MKTQNTSSGQKVAGKNSQKGGKEKILDELVKEWEAAQAEVVEATLKSFTLKGDFGLIGEVGEEPEKVVVKKYDMENDLVILITESGKKFGIPYDEYVEESLISAALLLAGFAVSNELDIDEVKDQFEKVCLKKQEQIKRMCQSKIKPSKPEANHKEEKS